MNTNVTWLCVTAETDPAKQYASISSDNYHEMRFSTRDKAKSYSPGDARRRQEIVFAGYDAHKPMPAILLSLLPVYEDGSPVPGCLPVRYSAPKPKAAIPSLPDVPSVVKFADDTWRVVPVHKFKTAHSPNGAYSQCPYAFEFRGSPMSGFFTATSHRELYESIVDTSRDAIASGSGQWLDPRDGRSPGNPSKEQIFRSMWPIATPAQVKQWADLVTARDQAIAAAEYELNREPTESEIAAQDVSDARINAMPAAVLKDMIFANKAFGRAYERKLKAQEAFDRKEKQERETALADLSARQARERLAHRDSPDKNTEALERRQKAEREAFLRQGQ